MGCGGVGEREQEHGEGRAERLVAPTFAEAKGMAPQTQRATTLKFSRLTEDLFPAASRATSEAR